MAIHGLIFFALAPMLTASEQVVLHAREQTTWGTVYDPAYVKLKYPGGDLPRNRGVCTDVVVRAFRAAGYDFQKLIYEDKKSRPSAYPKYPGQPGIDKNIDHRRVPNLVVFFKKHGLTLSKSLNASGINAWLPGDVVMWKLDNGRDHCGIISDRRGRSGFPMAIHNLGTTAEEDILNAWAITGHYRFPRPARRVP